MESVLEFNQTPADRPVSPMPLSVYSPTSIESVSQHSAAYVSNSSAQSPEQLPSAAASRKGTGKSLFDNSYSKSMYLLLDVGEELS